MKTFIVTFQCRTYYECECGSKHPSAPCPVTTNQSAETEEEAEQLVQAYFEEVGYQVLNHVKTRNAEDVKREVLARMPQARV